tara:strand:+ start:385 stop:1083 length:699 start_codon:yes stop_codon:yes gene_type:complete
MSTGVAFLNAFERIKRATRSTQQPTILQWVLLVTSVLTTARFLVLFAESYSLVSSERAADVDLLKLCSAGAAADSSKFRALCLKTRSESAAPLVLKAILKSFKTAFADFSESLNSPSRIAMLVLFCISGLALPIVKAISKLATLHLGPTGPRQVLDAFHGVKFEKEDDEEDGECHVVVLDGGHKGMLSRVKSRLKIPSRRSQLVGIPNEDEMQGEFMDEPSYVPLACLENSR